MAIFHTYQKNTERCAAGAEQWRVIYARLCEEAGCASGLSGNDAAARCVAASRWHLVFRCEGRRGGVRAVTEGAGSDDGTEPVCRSLRRQAGGVESGTM